MREFLVAIFFSLYGSVTFSQHIPDSGNFESTVSLPNCNYFNEPISNNPVLEDDLMREKRGFFGRRKCFKGFGRCGSQYNGHYLGHHGTYNHGGHYYDNYNNYRGDYHGNYNDDYKGNNYHHESSLLPQHDMELNYDKNKEHSKHDSNESEHNKYDGGSKGGHHLHSGHGYGAGCGKFSKLHALKKKCLHKLMDKKGLKKPCDSKDHSSSSESGENKKDENSKENKAEKKEHVKEVIIVHEDKKEESPKLPVYFPKALYYVPTIDSAYPQPVLPQPSYQPIHYSSPAVYASPNQYSIQTSSNYLPPIGTSHTPLQYTVYV